MDSLDLPIPGVSAIAAHVVTRYRIRVALKVRVKVKKR
jgi:hypothetical protein